ncbi:hypothetical protein CROQUDRAFT_190151 [Cronartium quercuum f. sp. fusiforme G11]|uniref:Uncharacterized protein n=1 Tax=Cronartium quercuum f. sp. fusiforme G11 TaxID=708437 RepID=A0A9P6T971_9BASI|nr:hypothetical protein CROQUDRAFT_190151 [Cronartium quercuum f. sp. fusiforme G11]
MNTSTLFILPQYLDVTVVYNHPTSLLSIITFPPPTLFCFVCVCVTLSFCTKRCLFDRLIHINQLFVFCSTNKSFHKNGKGLMVFCSFLFLQKRRKKKSC